MIALWLTMSVVFYLYLTTIASYDSVFGSLASVIVGMAYLYVSTIVFLFGAQLDAIIRAQTTGTLSGVERSGPVWRTVDSSGRRPGARDVSGARTMALRRSSVGLAVAPLGRAIAIDVLDAPAFDTERSTAQASPRRSALAEGQNRRPGEELLRNETGRAIT